MTPNPFLTKLNLPPDAKVVVIHADDIGMSYSTVAGFPALLDAGILSSAAVMVPCPWFPGAAAMARELSHHPRLDLGIHLTLTSEWDRYRWGPISTRARFTGLLDDEGYFHRLEAHVWEHAEPAAVARELGVQIETALAAGIDITHLDSHMGTLFHPQLLPIYLELAFEYQVPPFILRPDARHLQSDHLDPGAASALAQRLAEAETRGLPLFDRFHVMSLQRSGQGLEEARAVLSSLPAGSMTYLILHPNLDTPDLREFAPDWQARVDDYRLLMDPDFAALLEALNITVIGMRALRDAMRRAL